MKQKSNRLFHSSRWLYLATAMILMMTVLCLPLHAMNARNGRDDRGLIGDLEQGVRNFGRDVSDVIDPDNDGILPDGSLDNGIADDGTQNLPGTNNGTTGDTPAQTGDTTSDTNQDDTNDPAPGTSAATTTDANHAENGDTTDNNEDSGFRWTGLIIALVIIAAVVLLIILLMPKRKK